EVVQGRVSIGEVWSIELPWPFRRRREEGSLVLWQPGLTFWIDSFGPGTALEQIRADISPGAFDLRSEESEGLTRLTYRLREDESDAKAPSLYAFVHGARGHLQLGIYFDREEAAPSARAIVGTL